MQPPEGCPTTLLVDADKSRRERRLRYMHVDDKPIPWFEPPTRFASAMKTRTSPAHASARSMIEGGWWTPWRLHAAKMTSTSSCTCGKKVGCLWHLLAECPRGAELRAGYGDGGIFRASEEQEWNPLFSAGMPLRPNMPADPEYVTQAIGDESNPRVATGRVYTDGSLRGVCRRVLRAGWAFVVFNASDKPLWAKYGSLPDRYPSTLRSELRAVVEAVRMATGLLEIYTDCNGVVKGFRRGRTWTTSARQPAADLWRGLWKAIDETGSTVSVHKVAAHRSPQDVAEGRISPTNWLGNWIADNLAKKGGRLATLSSPTGRVEQEMRQAMKWYKWASVVAANWGEFAQDGDADEPLPPEHRDVCAYMDVPHDEGAAEDPPDDDAPRASRKRKAQRHDASETPPARAERPREAPWRLHHLQPHLLWVSRTAAICRRCGRGSAASAGSHRRAFARTPCSGAAAGRLLARLGIDLRAAGSRCRIAFTELMEKGYEPVGEDVADAALAQDLEPDPGMDTLEQGTASSAHGEGSNACASVQQEDAPPPAPHGPADGRDEPRDCDAPMDEQEVLVHSHVQPPGAHDAAGGDGATDGATLNASSKRIHSLDAICGRRDTKRARRDDMPRGADAKRQRPEPVDAQQDIHEGAAGRGKFARHQDPPQVPVSPAPAAPLEQHDDAVSAVSASSHEQAPAWLPSSVWGTGHKIQVRGPIAFCLNCGHYAIERVGHGLTEACTGFDLYARIKVQRMLQGLHPLHGHPLLPP